MPRQRRGGRFGHDLRGRLLAAGLLMFGPPGSLALACGYEDPASVALGSLNFAYPNALYVSTAVWQARQEGLLPKQPAAVKDPRWDAMRTLLQLRNRLVADPAMPALAIVFTPAVMWSRLTSQTGQMKLAMHESGPESADVVMVTEPAVLQAWLAQQLSTEQLIEQGLIRLYGAEQSIAAIRVALEHAEITPLSH